MTESSYADHPETDQSGAFLGMHMPDVSVLKDSRVRTLILAKNLQKLGIATISYGGMVYLAQEGASQLQVSLVGVTGYIAALLYGVQGGAFVDSVSKRAALMFGFAAQAALCLLVPLFLGTDVVDLVFLAFTVSLLSTITAPAIKASVSLVSTATQLATVAAMLNLLGSLGTAIGQAFVAPILIKVSGINAVMIAAGVFLAIGAIWVMRVPIESSDKTIGDAIRETELKPEALDIRGVTSWVVNRPHLASIILIGAIVVALGESLGTLIPVYVREVLDTDPAYSIYIFAPAGIGFLAGAFFAPPMIERFGERRVAVGSFFIGAAGIMALGFVDALAPLLGPISPTRLFELFGVELSDEMLAAGFIMMPANFGSTATGSAVQNYVNRRIPIEKQGAAFGMEKMIENGLTIVAVLSLGIIATTIGSQYVMIVAPILVTAIVIWLVRFSHRTEGDDGQSTEEIVHELLEGPRKATSQ